MQINPITEMQANLTVAKVLQRDLHSTIKDKQKAVREFYSAKEKSEVIQQPKQDTENNKHTKPSAFIPQSIISDKEKEQQLLQMAKSHYQSYQDVAQFADALSLRPGIVYLTLKHHGFIRQNETTEYRVLDAYYRYNGHLRAITEDVGLNVWICSETLKKLGLSPNWATYKTRAESGLSGDWAEDEFKRLVPSAIDMNMRYQMNNPRFDFIVNGKEIDVKFSSKRRTRGNNIQYAFRYDPDNLPDFFCLFLAGEFAEALQDKPSEYRILLLPKEIIPTNRKGTLHFTADPNNLKATSAMYWDFEVQPAALSAILGEL